jgi:hypothetical protein
MMKMRRRKAAVCCLALMLIALVACIVTWPTGAGNANEKAAGEVKPQGDPDEPVSEGTQRFHAQLLEIARTYKHYGRVDDEARWAPFLCRMPMPSVARFSASDEIDSHGRKLYFLFAKDRSSYVGKPKTPVSVGQVIVKESWLPVEVNKKKELNPWKDAVHETVKLDPAVRKKNPLAGDQGAYLPYATNDGKLYHATKQAGLYVMYKTDKTTPGTDNGWVYGTITADGKKVTAAGAIQSCMACHQEAPRDRLFGLRSGQHPQASK